MPEILKKFLWLFSDWLENIKDEKTDEALEKFKEASELASELQDKAEEMIEKSELAKFFESEEGQKLIKSLSKNEDLEKKVEDLEKSLADLQKEKAEDDKTVSEALTELDKELWEVATKVDSIEKTTVSKLKD